MGLCCGRERLLDADVQRLRSDGEPHAASRPQDGRLLDLGEAEQPAEEPARRRLAAGRRRDLHVVETEDRHDALSAW